MSRPVRIGTRGSRLAMWQAHHVKGLIERAHPDLGVHIVEVKTTGDRLQEIALTGGGGTGLFTKEIENALLDRRVDIAVHSLKDLPTVLVDGLALAAVPKREDTRDALVGNKDKVRGISDLKAGIRVGTGSPRRRGQILSEFPGVEVVPIRGNVPRRIARIDETEGPDAVVLALAGIRRLGLTEHVTEVFPTETMLPAPGQGAIGIEIREDDDHAREILSPLNDPSCRVEVRAERAFLRKLEGGCTVPAGALANLLSDGRLSLRAMVTDPDGEEVFRDSLEGSPAEPEALGVRLAELLLAAGAERILLKLRSEGR